MSVSGRNSRRLTPEWVGQGDRRALLAAMLGNAALAEHVSDDRREGFPALGVEPGRAPGQEIEDRDITFKSCVDSLPCESVC
jgi:hypothetical protein